jgi:hypothetical protein
VLEITAIIEVADALEAFFARYEHIAWAFISSVSFIAALFAIRYRYRYLFESSVDNAAEVKFKEYRQDQQGFMFDVAEARHDKMLGLYIDSQKDVAALRENYAANNGRVIDSD